MVEELHETCRAPRRPIRQGWSNDGRVPEVRPQAGRGPQDAHAPPARTCYWTSGTFIASRARISDRALASICT